MLYRLKRILAWLPLLWNDSEFDQSYLLTVLAFKLRRMSEYHTNMGHTQNRLRTAHQLTQAAVLCERMAAEDYGFSPQGDYQIKKEEYQYKQDLGRLCELFRKHLRTWWD